MKSSAFESVKEFHEKFGLHVEENPTLPNEQTRELRKKLLREEVDEYLEAEDNDDLTEMCRELSDVLYIVYGTAVSYGLPIDAMFREIHQSNMSKLDKDGKPLIREDGKILKGENFKKPDPERVMAKHSIGNHTHAKE